MQPESDICRNHFSLMVSVKSGVKISLLFLISLTFSSCEENMWLRSEKKLRGKIEGSWSRLFVTSNVTNNETWTFNDGVLVIDITEKTPNNKDDNYDDSNDADGLDTLYMDYGNYSVDANLDNAYLKLDNLEKFTIESAKQGLNAKWTIVDIDGGILYIAAENGSAIIQREFEKK